MTRKEMAIQNFLDGYNCSQSVVLAFADLLPIDITLLKRLSSSFGGGLGRMREVCGTVSGMAIVLGLLYGYDNPRDPEAKNAHYARIQEVSKLFEEKNGSIICRELLGLSIKHDVPIAEPRTETYYKKRPCKELAGQAAEILEDYIALHPFA